MDINDLDRMHNRYYHKWQAYFLQPYAIAYDTAYNNFSTKLKEQGDADKAALDAKIEFALFALSVAGGSLITSVFGSAILQNTAKRLSTNFEKHFRMTTDAAGFKHANDTAEFIVGEVWGKASELLSKAAQSSFEVNGNNYSGLDVEYGLTRPSNEKSRLEQWLHTASWKGRRVAEELKDKPAELAKLAAAPYFSYAPTVALNDGTAAEEIELSFWMKYIMQLDYLETGVPTFTGGMVKSRTPIEAGPRDKAYPKSYQAPPTAGSIAHYQRVRYHPLGDIVRKRINELNTIHFKQKFIERNEEISASVISRADSNLNGLRSRNRALAQLKSEASQ